MTAPLPVTAPLRVTAPRRTTTTDHVYDAILTAVLDGDISPGTHLTLQDLADQLGTSLQPVREAIRQLEAVGIIEVLPHRGARLRLLTDEDFEDTYRARLTIEGFLVERAAEQFTSDDEREARGHLGRQQRAIDLGDRAMAREAHQEFHFTLYRAARSPWMFRSMLPTWHNAERYRLADTVRAASVKQRRAEHEQMLDACVQHDPAAAREALRSHLLHSVRRRSPQLADEL